MRFILTMLLAGIISSCLNGQKISDQQTLNLDVSQIHTIRIHNFKGKVNVTGSNSNQLKIEAQRTLKSQSSKRINELKSEIVLDHLTEDGVLVCYIKSPNIEFKIDAEGNASYNSWNPSNSGSGVFEVSFQFNLEVSMPKDKNLMVSTHHKPIVVDGINKDVIAKTHHDDLTIKNAGGNVSAKSHHGNVEVFYTKNPTKDGYYKSHHGDVRVTYQSAFSAEVSLNSHHGEFLSAFDWSLIPQKVGTKNGSKSTKYIVGNETIVKIGNGGPKQTFRTHHGDIFLLKN